MGLAVAVACRFQGRWIRAHIGWPTRSWATSLDAATLEITFLGPELAFEDDRTVAVCGADFVVTVGDHLAASGVPFRVPRGGRLRFGARSRGVAAYLAVDGGFAVEPVFGSRATHVSSRIGGYHGRAVGEPAIACRSVRQRGRRAVSASPGRFSPCHAVTRAFESCRPATSTSFRRDALDQAAVRARYAIRTESDRMGYRLEGPALRTTSPGHLLSDPSPLGALQVPPDGQPILLMADRQTTGGYPKLATVITADIGLAGQLGPGDTIAFAVCTRQEATRGPDRAGTRA